MFILVNGGSLRIKLKQVANLTYVKVPMYVVLVNKSPATMVVFYVSLVFVLLLFQIVHVKVVVKSLALMVLVL